ncbi:MAG: carbon starvation protein A [Candidatus Schekmanbacteria bacterium]|nr:MAG: carbon starvation protein A [Candidatus Schekmanbacteria bacterium]
MNGALLAVIVIAAFLASYFSYAGILGKKVLRLDASRITPAHKFRDDIDFVPTNRFVLFGHHFASIAGAAPIVGPAIAVIYGWLPGLLWIVFGSIFLGAAHDFAALVVSLRHGGRSIGDLTKDIIGARARNLFLILIYFGLSIVLAVFALVIGVLFKEHPQAVFPTFFLIALAMVIGTLVYKTPIGLGPATVAGVLVMGWSIWYGVYHPIGADLETSQWITILMIYAFVASILPVWFLLQPRDYLNSFALYFGLGAMYLGLFIVRPEIVAPVIRIKPEGAPPIFPFLFILIACGAISGFHSLVASGTTAKQIDKETDSKFVGYGAMLAEGALATMALIACTAGIGSAEAWQARYATWGAMNSLQNKLGAFVDGAGGFVSALGFSLDFSKTLVVVIVVSFAMTTLDTCARMLRFIVSEIGESAGITALKNRYIASAVAVLSGLALAKIPMGKVSTGMALWPVFGATNQILGALALLTISVYLFKRQRPIAYSIIPMFFMLAITISAMMINIKKYYESGNYFLLIVGSLILLLEIWLAFEAFIVFRESRTEEKAVMNSHF